MIASFGALGGEMAGVALKAARVKVIDMVNDSLRKVEAEGDAVFVAVSDSATVAAAVAEVVVDADVSRGAGESVAVEVAGADVDEAVAESTGSGVADAVAVAKSEEGFVAVADAGYVDEAVAEAVSESTGGSGIAVAVAVAESEEAGAEQPGGLGFIDHTHPPEQELPASARVESPGTHCEVAPHQPQYTSVAFPGLDCGPA